MSEKKISLDLEINQGGADKTVKSIKTELREAKEEAIALARKFGELSPEATAAASKLAKLRDEFGDLNQAVQGLNPDKFARIATLTNGVVRGFQAASGAAVLFGKTGEDIEKTIAKLQATMALADGIQGVMDARKQFAALANQIKGGVVKAFSTLKGAIIATGIGALAVVLGLVIANFEQVKKYILNLFPGLGKLTDFIGGLVDKFTDFIGVTTEAGRALEKSIEKQTTALEKLNGWLDRNLDKYNKHTAAKLQADAEYKEAKLNLDKQLNDGLDKQSYDQYLKELSDKKDRAIHKADEDRKIEAQALRDKIKADAEKIAQDRKTADEKLEAARQLKLKEQLEEIDNLDKQSKLKGEAGIKEADSQIEVNGIERKNTNEFKNQQAEDLKKSNDALYGINEAARKKDVEGVKVAEEAKRQSRMAGLDNLASIGQSMQTLFSKNKQLVKAGLLIEEAAAIAKIIMNTQVAAAKALVDVPFPLGPIVAGTYYAAGALSIAASIKATNDAMKQLGGGGGSSSANLGGGAATGGGIQTASSGFTTVSNPRTNNQATNTPKQPPIKVFVVQKDIAQANIDADNILAKAVLK